MDNYIALAITCIGVTIFVCVSIAASVLDRDITRGYLIVNGVIYTIEKCDGCEVGVKQLGVNNHE